MRCTRLLAVSVAALCCSGCILLSLFEPPEVDLCTEADVLKLTEQCGITLISDVNRGGPCRSLADGEAVLRKGEYGEHACRVARQGEFVSCFAKNINATEDGTCASDPERWRRVMVQCDPTYPEAGPPVGNACSDTCWSQVRVCRNNCPRTSATACFDCEADCGEEAARCVESCPRSTSR